MRSAIAPYRQQPVFNWFIHIAIKRFFIFLVPVFTLASVKAQQFVQVGSKPEGFSFTANDLCIYTDSLDNWLVLKSASLLQKDIETLYGKKPRLVNQLPGAGKNIIIIGTIAGCPAIKKLEDQKKITVQAIRGKWEAFQVQSLALPEYGITNALVISGSDKRGTAYGVFELSKQLGISPWYYWADVPPQKKAMAFVKKGVYIFTSPSVKYRGIFINDEAPAFSGWTREKFGGVNHLVYEKIFELLLRLKGNYLWPAMWGNAFNDDDTLNPVLADKWGIVMGTSHHEPMMRAQQEWKRYGKGPWDYTKNDTVLKNFWRTGIEHMGAHESIVTIGMRGDGDMPMSNITAVELLENIVSDQRKIIAAVTQKPPAETPQLWALYKEVQDYYDKGMRVPDDVTLLLCDDNWGNIRRLPRPADTSRPGGFGIYYHFDYVGGPRNYKWINTNNISRVWEQMHMAYAYKADKIWIVNVGDLKPMEMPISFFLDYAYNTNKWNEDNITGFYSQWALEQFGPAYAKEAGKLLQKFSFYAARRKPELLDAATYHLDNYDEFKRVLTEWTTLLREAESLEKKIPVTARDAYFELVLHPIQAMENLHKLYYAVAMNKWWAAQNSEQANRWADSAKLFYDADSLLTLKYNHEIAGGKWNHMMDQTHIGYTSWQEPRKNRLPALTYIPATVTSSSTGNKNETTVLHGPAPADQSETGNNLVLAASAYTKALGSPGIHWKIIPDIGKNGDGITSFPVTAGTALTASGPHLEYAFSSPVRDSITIASYFSPTLNFLHSSTGLRFALSVDNGPPTIVELNKEDNTGAWNAWVANNIIIKKTRHFLSVPGKHVIKYWMIDPGIVLQNLVLQFTDPKPAYLLPIKTYHKTNN
jgi:hypothetical protein